MTNQTLSNRELTLRSRRVLDLHPHKTRLIALAGISGVILIIVASLVGNRPETVGVDKLLHFGGYATLAAVFVLSLSPRWYLLSLAGLFGLGVLIELLQPLNMRLFEVNDIVANTAGVLVGAAVGLGARLAYSHLKTELAASQVRYKLLSFAPGEVIIGEGEMIDRFYVIKQGTVALYRQQDGVDVLITREHAGEMFGLLEEILREPVVTTVVAETAVQLYRIDYDKLIADVGGRSQPLGIVLDDLAADLREAWQSIASLKQATDTCTPQTMQDELVHIEYSRKQRD